MRQPTQISGQGVSPYAYYRQAHEVLFADKASYVALDTHGCVFDALLSGEDVLVADTALYGGIEASRDSMPDVFEHTQIMSYRATVLDVVFHLYRHPETDPEQITKLLTQAPVVGHCHGSIQDLEELLKRKLRIDFVDDSGLSAEAIRNDGTHNKEHTYAICSEIAGEACELTSDGIMSDNPGATRFIAYNNDGYYDPTGNNQVVALRVDDSEYALLDALRIGFEVNMHSLVQLNNPLVSDHADFAIEISEDMHSAQDSVERLVNAGFMARILGQYTPIDKRVDMAVHGDFNYQALKTTSQELFTLCLDMKDSSGGLVETLEQLRHVDLHGIRISEMLKADLSRVVALDISLSDRSRVEKIINGKGVYLGT